MWIQGSMSLTDNTIIHHALLCKKCGVELRIVRPNKYQIKKTWLWETEKGKCWLCNKRKAYYYVQKKIT